MITDKQRQRDYEYDGEYQSKSRYTDEQWTNILSSGQLSEEDTLLLRQIYRSYNHAATLLQLAFHNKTTEEALLAQCNAIGELLAKANDIQPDVDLDGNEYWWFLFFWGKNTDAGTLELKLHPELTEAIGALWPEEEERYYAFMNDVDRSLQIRYSQEDGLYHRYQSDQPQKSDEGPLTVKNVIIQYCQAGYYADTLYRNINVNTSEWGYFATGGKAVPITWKKEDGVTRYYGPDGQEIRLNPGKTWVCILSTADVDRTEFYGE